MRSQSVGTTPGFVTADRRLSCLRRHLDPISSSSSSPSAGIMESSQTISASPTSAFDSVFAHLAQAPEDSILGVTVAFNKDPSPIKLNLGVGAYRTETPLHCFEKGKCFEFKCVLVPRSSCEAKCSEWLRTHLHAMLLRNVLIARCAHAHLFKGGDSSPHEMHDTLSRLT